MYITPDNPRKIRAIPCYLCGETIERNLTNIRVNDNGRSWNFLRTRIDPFHHSLQPVIL